MMKTNIELIIKKRLFYIWFFLLIYNNCQDGNINLQTNKTSTVFTKKIFEDNQPAPIKEEPLDEIIPLKKIQITKPEKEKLSKEKTVKKKEKNREESDEEKSDIEDDKKDTTDDRGKLKVIMLDIKDTIEKSREQIDENEESIRNIKKSIINSLYQKYDHTVIKENIKRIMEAIEYYIKLLKKEDHSNDRENTKADQIKSKKKPEIEIIEKEETTKPKKKEIDPQMTPEQIEKAVNTALGKHLGKTEKKIKKKNWIEKIFPDISSLKKPEQDEIVASFKKDLKESISKYNQIITNEINKLKTETKKQDKNLEKLKREEGEADYD